MITTCPKCSSKLSVDETMIGHRVQCAGCRHFFDVPAPPGYTPPTSASAPAPIAPKPAKPAKPTKPVPVTKAPAPQAPTGAPAAPAPAPAPPVSRLGGPAMLGKLLILSGLVLVLLARGGHTISTRGVARAQAKESLARTDFNDDWDNRIQEAREDKDTKKVTSLQAAKTEEQAKLTKGEWRDLKRDARDASTHQKVLAYWLEWLFWLGSIVLVVGLLLLAFYGTGAERMVCLIMIAIITFSLYVGRLGVLAGPGR